MRTEHLRYLIEINKHHSISIAAQHLYISQTSLSITLKNIEDELGLRIFQRTHSGVRLTPEGEEALALIMEIEQRMEEIRQLGSQVHLQNRTVPVISSPTILSGLTLPLHKAFLEAVPSGNLSFFSVSGEEVGTKIIKNEGHIGLTYFSRQTLSDYRMVAAKYCIQVEALFPDRFYLLAPKDHPLAKYSSIHCKELEGLNFARLPSYNSSEGLLAHLTIFGSGNHYTTFPDIALIKKAVLTQGMVAVLSGYAIYHDHSCDNSQMKVIQLTGTPVENEMKVCLIHSSDGDLRYQEKLAIQCIKEYFQGLPPLPFAPG